MARGFTKGCIKETKGQDTSLNSKKRFNYLQTVSPYSTQMLQTSIFGHRLEHKL